MITVIGKTNGRTSVRPFGDIKNRNALKEVHMPFDLLLAFFFFAMTLLLECAPTRQNGGALQMNAA
jgi:hypothetical protein